MNTQKKHKKEVRRKKEVKKKLLNRRLRKRAENKKITDEQKQKRDAERIVNKHTATICYDKAGRLSEEDIRQRLDKNMEVLRALQEEYEAEQKLRAANQSLIPDIQKQLHAEPIRNWGGSAEVEFKPNTEVPTTSVNEEVLPQVEEVVEIKSTDDQVKNND